MKAKITLFLVLSAFVFNAQVWNKTFNVNGNDDYLAPSFVIGTSDLGSASVSWANDLPSWPSVDYFILTKHDAYGNVVFNNRIYPLQPQQDGFVEVRALIETDDRGILIAGYYYYDINKPMQPFLVKVDYNGSFQWSRWFPVNSNQFKGYAYNKVSLARVEDDEKENYFLVSAADSDADPGNGNVVNVIKFDAGGNLIWTKKYFDSNPSNYSVWDLPGDIAFSKSDRMYMITGWRVEYQFTQVDKMFFFGIDRDGNVVTNYKALTVPGIPRGQDMIWDPNTKYFATTYIHDNLDPNTYQYTYSTIGLITIDAGLNINLHKMYWHEEAKENHGVSISLSVDKDYVIGCYTYDGNIGARNPSLLKVDNSGNPLWLWRYNIKDDVIFGHHNNSFDPISAEEQYVLIGVHKTDLRVLRTTINGKTCGAVEYRPIELEYDYREELFKYYPREIGDIKKYEPWVKELRPEERECTDATWNSYRGVAPGEANAIGEAGMQQEGGLNIYPSQVAISEPVFVMDNSSSTSLSVQVIDMTGKLIYKNDNLSSGKSNVSLAGGQLAEGVYLVKYHSVDGMLTGSKKIIVTR